MIDSSMKDLTAQEVEDAASHFLEEGVMEELRTRDRLGVPWVQLLVFLCMLHGHTKASLRL